MIRKSQKKSIKSQALKARSFGLHPVRNSKSKNPLPLQKIRVKVDIKSSVARVELIQTFINDTDHLLEVEYYFPIPENACFNSFKATFEHRVIEGVIEEKDKARKDYTTNIQKGNTTAYAEFDEESKDIMKVQIGNITPAAVIEVSVSYLQQLEIIRNRFHKFTFKSKLPVHSRHGILRQSKRSAKEEGDENCVIFSEYPQHPSQEGTFWAIELEVECRSPITHFECVSHDVQVQKLDNPCVKRARFDPNSKNFSFNKDFVIFFSEEEFNSPTYRIAKNESGFCAMIDFVPRLSDETLSDAAQAARDQMQISRLNVKQLLDSNNEEEINLLTATGEYLFFIDRSGSMRGKKMELAKEALIFALKSLPPNSYFNVCSFGTKHKFVFETIVESSEQNIQKAITEIKDFESNMVGTNVLPPLLQVLKGGRRKKHPRTIFLITDGAVENMEIVLEEIENYRHRNRVFSLGIGDECSEELVEGAAERGNGKAEFVSDPEDIATSIISLMTAAIVPVCDDFSLKFSAQDVVSLLSLDPATQPYLLRNERATYFIFLSNDALSKGRYFEASLRYFNSSTNDYNENTVVIDLENYETTLDIFKLGIWTVAETLVLKESELSREVPDIYWSAKSSISEEIVKMSVVNQVLTPKTAFICVIKENSKDEIDVLRRKNGGKASKQLEDGLQQQTNPKTNSKINREAAIERFKELAEIVKQSEKTPVQSKQVIKKPKKMKSAAVMALKATQRVQEERLRLEEEYRLRQEEDEKMRRLQAEEEEKHRREAEIRKLKRIEQCEKQGMAKSKLAKREELLVQLRRQELLKSMVLSLENSESTQSANDKPSKVVKGNKTKTRRRGKNCVGRQNDEECKAAEESVQTKLSNDGNFQVTTSFSRLVSIGESVFDVAGVAPEKWIRGEIQLNDDFECLIAKVTVVEGVGVVIDCVLVNGTIKEGDKIVLRGLKNLIYSPLLALIDKSEISGKVDQLITCARKKEITAPIKIKMIIESLTFPIIGEKLYLVKKEYILTKEPSRRI